MILALEASGDGKELCRQSYRQGYVAEKLGKKEKALASYRRAFDLDRPPTSPRWEGSVTSWCRRWQHRRGDAGLHRDPSSTTARGSPTSRWSRPTGRSASWPRRWGRPSAAINTFKKAARDPTPTTSPPRRSLARLLQRRGTGRVPWSSCSGSCPVLDGPAKFETLVAIGEACRTS